MKAAGSRAIRQNERHLLRSTDKTSMVLTFGQLFLFVGPEIIFIKLLELSAPVARQSSLLCLDPEELFAQSLLYPRIAIPRTANMVSKQIKLINGMQF